VPALHLGYLLILTLYLSASDLKLVLLILYTVVTTLHPGSPSITLHFLHALAWRMFHSFALGFILRAQSSNKFLVRHFVKHYYYPYGEDSRSGRKAAVEEAFANWKAIYNMSLCMTYGSSFLLLMIGLRPQYLSSFFQQCPS
jgi:phosphatidylethanolamine N-methyltransferase